MRRPLGSAAALADSSITQPRPSGHHPRSFTMQWTAPQATDLRFGFEITMYISAR